MMKNRVSVIKGVWAKYAFKQCWRISALTLVTALFITTSFAFGFNFKAAYKLQGYDRQNTANTSKGTSINKNNYHKLKLKWIHNIDSVPLGTALNPSDDYRMPNSPTSGVATDLLGLVYVHLLDGRTLVINSNSIVGTNADGSDAPEVVGEFDLFADPKYMGAPDGVTPPLHPAKYDVAHTRMHPSIIGFAIYAGNYPEDAPVDSSTGAWQNKAAARANPDDPNYRSDGGAVLYKINRFTGDLMWKSIIDPHPQSGLSAGSVSTPSLFHPLIFVPFMNIITGSAGSMAITDAEGNLAPPYQNNDFFTARGGLAAVNKYTGDVVWRVYTLPKSDTVITSQDAVDAGTVNAWSGGSSWGAGSPAISKKHNLVYFGVGEAATATTAASDCEFDRLLANPDNPAVSEDCLDFDQNGDPITGELSDTIVEASSDGALTRSPTHPLPVSVIAVDMYSGDIKWAQRVNGLDAWNAACIDLAATFGLGPDPVPINLTVPPILGFTVDIFFSGRTGFFSNDPSSNQQVWCPGYVRDDNLRLQLGETIDDNLPEYRQLFITVKDLDVGEQPMLVENVVMENGNKRDVVIVTNKGARVHAFDAKTGTSLWVVDQLGSGDLFGDGILWGSATDGKKIYVNTGRSSQVTLADLSDIDPDNPNISKTNKVVIDSCTDIEEGFDANGNWTGGMYAAIDIAKGKVAWQRCVTGKEVNNDDRLLTGRVLPGRTQGGLSVANGIVIAPGASSYDLVGIIIGDSPFAEVLLLDADNGDLLRALPMSVPDEPTANTIIYQRAVAIGDRIYITNGFRRQNSGSPPPLGDSADQDEYNRVVAYELDTKGDHHDDDD